MATAKKPAGRPRKQQPEQATEIQAPVETKNFRSEFEEDIYQKVPREYEVINGGGILYLMGKSEYSAYDKDKGSVMSIRYCEGENSIYKDDQSEASVMSPVVFENKRLFVPPTKPNLAKFLDKHPFNEKNGGSIFRFVDYQKNAKDTIEKEFEVVDALVLVRTKPADELLSVATSLGINTERLMVEVKHDLTIYAKRNPKVFVSMFDNPATKVKSDVKNAISFGILSTNGGYVRWKDTNNHIIAIPEGKDAVDVFVRYCLTEAGSVVYDEIKRQL
jgi:hypothetical protein